MSAELSVVSGKTPLAQDALGFVAIAQPAQHDARRNETQFLAEPRERAIGAKPEGNPKALAWTPLLV